MSIDILPAAAEGELRDLARDLRSNGAPFEADRLERIVNCYSGIRVLRDDCDMAHCPPTLIGRQFDWHRGSGCAFDDGRPRTAESAAEIAKLGIDHPRAPFRRAYDEGLRALVPIEMVATTPTGEEEDAP